MKARKYQLSIINTAYQTNTLVVLPTGLGKTLIAFLLARLYLNKYKGKKVLFLAPTRPLVVQHKQSCDQTLPEFKSTVFTGYIKSDKRSELFKQNDIIFSTPQGFENDLISKKIDINQISMIIFDEAHRATGNYAYTYIAKEFSKNKSGRILALTASPGSDIESITEVCSNLFIKELEYRTIYDSDVREYVQETSITELNCEFPDTMREIQKNLNLCINEKIAQIKRMGYCNIDTKQLTRTKLLKLQSGLAREMINGNKDFDLLKSVSLAAQTLKASHAVELLETQDLNSLIEYFQQLDQDSKKTKVKATINLVKDPNWISAKNKAMQLQKSEFEHPKLAKLKELLSIKFENNPNFKCLIFHQYRDSSVSVYNTIQKLPGAKPVLFFGQSKKKGRGHSQKEQKEIIEQFKNDEYNILIATSVAEEGLDIPQVNSVIFFEPVPSAIRSIQRRGRTGRHDEGSIYVLINKGTRDESYKWSSFHKEKRMYRVLKDLKKNLTNKKIIKKLEIDNEKEMINDLANKMLSPSKTEIENTSYVHNQSTQLIKKPAAINRLFHELSNNIFVELNRAELDKELDNEINKKFNQKIKYSANDHQSIPKSTKVFDDPLLEDLKPVKKTEVTSQVKPKSLQLKKEVSNSLSQTNLFSFDTGDESKQYEKENETKNEPKNATNENQEISLEPIQASSFKVFVDHREKGSNLIRELQDNNIDVELKSLVCADYLLSENVAIEYKLDNDFINSIYDGRLFAQAKELAYNYLKPIIVVESNSSIFEKNIMGNNQLYGAITSLMLDFNIQVIFTRNKKETIDFFKTIIKREQNEDFKHFNPHASNKPKDLKSQIEYVTSALPGLGLNLAKSLLYHFGNLKNIANADLAELQKVEKIGPTKAKYIHEIFNKLLE